MKRRKYQVVPTTKEKLYDVFARHGLNNISTICNEMGRANNYINEQLREMGGVTVSTAAFLEAKYGIKREEYEVRPDPAKPETPVASAAPEWDSDKLYGIVFTAAVNGAKKGIQEATPKTDKPAPVKMDLCPGCYHKMLCTDFLHKIEGGADYKIICGKCGRRAFGGTYSILQMQGGFKNG